MRDRDENTEKKLAEQQSRAASKVAGQKEVVRRMNGSADKHPEQQLLLNEMQQNKAAIDLNRTLFDYGRSDDKDQGAS